MTDDWVPLWDRDDPTAMATYNALHPDVPSWLEPSLWEWCRGQLHRRGSSGGLVVDADKFRRLERAFRINLGWDGSGYAEGVRVTENYVRSSSRVMLQVTDHLAHQLTATVGSTSLVALSDLLAESCSEWEVSLLADGHGALQRRLPEGVAAAARATVAAGGSAGRLLANAWEEMYGLHSDPSAAYRAAVRSVEAAACPVVLPNDPLPTLGRVIAALRDGKKKWLFVFQENDKVDTYDVMVGLLQSLWTNQYDRHVTEGRPLSVTNDEAQAAVVLAVTLVQWFSAGLVKRATKE